MNPGETGLESGLWIRGAQAPPPSEGVCACAPAAYRPSYPAGLAPRHFLATRRQIAHQDDFCLTAPDGKRQRPPDRTVNTPRDNVLPRSGLLLLAGKLSSLRALRF